MCVPEQGVIRTHLQTGIHKQLQMHHTVDLSPSPDALDAHLSQLALHLRHHANTRYIRVKISSKEVWQYADSCVGPSLEW